MLTARGGDIVCLAISNHFSRLCQSKIVFYDETHCKWMVGLGGSWKKEESNYIWKQKL